jgi:hypothetical protein
MPRQFTGAGVLLVKLPYVILFHSSFRHTYEDLGGGIENEDNNDLEKTAKREAMEESCGLIYIPDHIRLKLFVNVKGYRCYILLLNKNIHEHDYFNNYNVIRRNKMFPGTWQETNRVTYIKISNILNIVPSHNKYYCKDIHNHTVKIFRRTIKCVNTLVDSYKLCEKFLRNILTYKKKIKKHNKFIFITYVIKKIEYHTE